MIKKIVKNDYTIEYLDSKEYSEEEINHMIDDAIVEIENHEAKDTNDVYVEDGVVITPRGRFQISEKTQEELEAEGFGRYWEFNGYVILTNPETNEAVAVPIKYNKDSINDFLEPISSFKTFKFMEKTRQGLEVVKAFKDQRDSRMHVIVHRPSDNSYIIGLGYSPDDGTWNQGRYDYKSAGDAETALRKEYNVVPFELEEVKDSEEKLYRVNHFSYKREKYFIDMDGLSLDAAEKLFNETIESLKNFNENTSFKDEFIIFLDEDTEYLNEHIIKTATVEKSGEIIRDAKIKDIPLNAPEENVDITYTEKLKGGKNALTYGMIENAFKERNKDDGKTFAAYVDVVIESLKDDIKNAKYIISGEMKSTRKLLLEDYVKIEHLVEKAGMKDKLAEIKPLVDELSEKLDLNYWKQPKFKPQERKSAAKELRGKHRFDSRIEKSLKPVFLCSKADLTASYNDAKQGKLPQVFEANLRKVEKDIEADYDRINQGRDRYLEDPRIVQLLPEIISLYELATKYALDLGYTDIGKRFAYMIATIKKGWGLE